MVLPQGLGHEACKADWRKEGKGSRCPEDRRNSALYLCRRHIVRLGPGEGGLTLFLKFLVRPAGPAMSRWDGGRGDLGQSGWWRFVRTPLQTLRRPIRTSS